MFLVLQLHETLKSINVFMVITFNRHFSVFPFSVLFRFSMTIKEEISVNCLVINELLRIIMCEWGVSINWIRCLSYNGIDRRCRSGISVEKAMKASTP